MISLIFIQSFLQICFSQMIMDNQVEEVSLYNIQNDDTQFSIFVRFQPQFISHGNSENNTPFLSIVSWDLKIPIIFSYKYKDQLQVSISIKKPDYFQNLISLKSYDIKTWICINLLKEEQSWQISAENTTIQLPKVQQQKYEYYGTLITWQNLTFSLRAYKGDDQFNHMGYFHLMNNPILKLYQQIVMNYKSQIQLEMHIRKKYEDKLIIMQIKDQEHYYFLAYGENSIQIIIDSEYERSEKHFYNITHNQWFRLKINFEQNRTISVIDTINEQFEWIYENKFLQQFEGVLPQYYGLIIEFFNRQTEIDNIIIINNKSQQVEHICYPGCKICKELQCLECQNNLLLSDQCSCEDNQYYDYQIGVCKDITQYPGLQQNTKQIQICSFYQYYNSQRQQCMECPHIEQYYCTDCIYNTKLWQTHKTCTFQEMQSDIFLHYQSVNYDLDPNTYKLVFNEDYSQITNQKCDFYQEEGVIQCKTSNQDYFMRGICDLRNYNIIAHQCKSHRGVFHQHQNLVMCQQNYTLIKNKCVKCQLHCIICAYDRKQTYCLITKEKFNIEYGKNLVKLCKNNCTYLKDLNQNEISFSDKRNCLFEYNNSCIYCKQNFILNLNLNCSDAQTFSKFFNFQFFANNQKFLSKNQLAQFSSNKNEKIEKHILQQILFYARQYESINSNNHYTFSKNSSRCLNAQYFNQSYKCLEYQQNYVQLSDNLLYYCLNDYCSYNLTLNLRILISNRQQIIYENVAYYSIQELLSQLLLKVHILEITFIASVYVLDSYDQECFDQQIFVLNQAKLNILFPNTQFKLILEFQAPSQFPKCWHQLFYSNFQYIQIKNLRSNNLEYIELQSDQILFYNCKFLNKESFSIILDASRIQFRNITFIHTLINRTLIQITHSTLIEEVQFLSCNFVDLFIEETNFIVIETQVKYLKIYNLAIFEVKMSDCSFFLFFNFQEIQAQLIYIGQLEIYQASIFRCLIVQVQDSQIDLENINIVDSQFLLSSFYFINAMLNVQNLKVIDTIFSNSQIFNLVGRIVFVNALFQGLQLNRSWVIKCQAKEFNLFLKDIQILDTLFNQSVSSFEITANQLDMINFQILNCIYSPQLNILDILGRNCNILDFTFENVIIEQKNQQQIVQIPDYMINIEFEQLKTKNFRLENVMIDQAKLMHLSYQNAYIQETILKNFTFIGGTLSELIMLSEHNQSSLLKIHTLHIINFNINWQQSSKLFHIKGYQGKQQMTNLIIFNILSIQEFQIIFCSQNKMFLKSIFTNFDQFVGFIKQFQSIIRIQDYVQKQYIQGSFMWNTPIFTNLDYISDYEQISIMNSSFVNLKQPIAGFKHNKWVIFKAQKINVLQFASLRNIFAFTLGNYSYQEQQSLVFSLHFYKLNIKANIESNIVFLYQEFGELIMSKIQFRNTNLIILQARFIGITKITDISVQNSILQHQSFFIMRNIQSHFLARNINIKNQQGISDIFEIELFFQYRYLIQLINIFIDNCRNCKSFMIINDTKQFDTPYNLRQIVIQNSNFINGLFYIIMRHQLQVNINRLKLKNIHTNNLFDNLFQQAYYQLQHVSLINVIIKNEMKLKQQFIKSYIFNSTMNGFQLVLVNSQLMIQKDEKLIQEPIAISFSEQGVFRSKLINENCYQTYYINNQSIAYVPTGIPLSEYIYINPITKLQEKPYSNFIIILNLQSDDQINCQLKQSIDGQVGNYSNINQFELQNGINIIQNFTFLMNPYLNYIYIQNDIICNDLTIRFNTKALPCQLGEYLNQNRCLICDIKRNYYSVTKKAQLCNIINEDQIEQLNYGNIKLKPGFWRAKSDSNKVEQCINQQCGGGWVPGDHSCNIGYVGALCKECDIYNIKGNGKFASYNDRCNLCEFDYTIVLKGVFVLMWLMMLAYLSYDTNRSLTQQYLFYKITQRNVAEILMRQSINQISVIIKIMTNYCFYLYLFRDKLDFLYQQVNISLDLISNPQLIIKPHLDCLFVRYNQIGIHYIQLIFTILSPFFTLALFYLIYLILLSLKLIQFQFGFILITIYSVYLFNQQLIFQNQIQLLSYNTVSNIKWIYINQQFQYSTNLHYKFQYYFIIPTNLILILIPMTLYLILRYKDKKSLQTTKFFGILFKEYKLQSYYWEILRIYQKYLTIMIIYYFKGEFLLLLIQICLGLFISNQPYPLKNLNYLEQKSLYILLPILIDLTYTNNHSNFTRSIQFMCLNIIFINDIFQSLIQKAKIQYKDQIVQIKLIVTQKIPISNKFIKNNSQRLSYNILKMKQSYLKLKNSQSMRPINLHGQIILSSNTNNYQISPTEIEMTEVKTQQVQQV